MPSSLSKLPYLSTFKFQYPSMGDFEQAKNNFKDFEFKIINDYGYECDACGLDKENFEFVSSLKKRLKANDK